MSRDRDPQQRRWLSLGYGGKSAPSSTWRYWKQPKHEKQWFIAAPNDLAIFEQHDRSVLFNGRVVATGATQWHATWAALAYFYAEVVPNLPSVSLALNKARARPRE